MTTRIGLAAAVLALAAPATAGAANGPLHVNEGGRTGASADAHVEFLLGAGWEQTRGAMAGTPSLGAYHRSVDLGAGATCRLDVRVSGFAVRERDRPVLRRGVLRVTRPGWWRMRRFAVARRAGSPRRTRYVGAWATGQSGPLLTGLVVLRSPSWLAGADRRLTLGRVDVEGLAEHWRAIPQGLQPVPSTAGQRAACAAVVRREAPGIVTGVLRGLRVRRGPATA